MRKVINCECGEVVRGDSDEELLAAVKAHLTRDHPELLEKLSREDILGMAEEDE
jgi:predicted small metal-binding protein